MSDKQNKFNFYEVDIPYIQYLKKFDSRIPNIEYKGQHDKFLCGILFQNEGLCYFAPISHFTKPQATNLIIEDKKGNNLGSIRFSFMFPVPFSLVKIKDFKAEEKNYRNLLVTELDWCNQNQERIINRAIKTYEGQKKGQKLYLDTCCDFPLLEQKCKDYILQMQKQQEPPIEEIKHKKRL